MSQLDAFLRESIDRYNNENDIPEASAGDELSADIAEIVGNRLSQIVAEASIRVSDGSAIATTQSLVHLHAALAGLALTAIARDIQGLRAAVALLADETKQVAIGTQKIAGILADDFNSRTPL